MPPGPNADYENEAFEVEDIDKEGRGVAMVGQFS